MKSSDELVIALDMALATAHTEYRNAVVQLAEREAAKDSAPSREPADVDHIHHARTRVIALDAAREELSQMIDEGVPLTSD